MILTKKLRKWVLANCDVEDDAEDKDLLKAAGLAWASGDLTTEKMTELTKDDDADDADAFSQELSNLSKGIGDLTNMLKNGKFGKEDDEELEEEESDELDNEDKSSEPDKKKAGKPKGEKADPPAWHKSIKKVMGMDPPVNEDGSIRVKGAWEQYSTEKSTLTYPERTKGGKPHSLAGRPVVDFTEGGGRTLDTASDLDKAVSGAYAKLLCATAQRGGSKTFGFQSLQQHDRELLFHALENMDWVGSTDGGDFADIKGRRLTPREQKDIIDDAVSGGLEAAPIVFDDQVIRAPLLHGELFPLVNQVPLDRGRRIEGVATGTVTGAWGGVDATPIGLFATAGYITAFDTTVYRWEGAIRIGLDFLSDTPIDFGAHVTSQYGERLLEDLDDVIATGNGATQPEGVINHAGITTVAWGGVTSIGNYESLRFGVAKAEHRSTVAASAVFCGTETSYQRVMALPVGAADARRLFGTGQVGGTNAYDGYSIMQRPYKINESLANTQIFYAILARYRMYRRRGLTMRTSREGDTLIRANEMLMVATARYGGQIERAACGAITVTAPA